MKMRQKKVLSLMLAAAMTAGTMTGITPVTVNAEDTGIQAEFYVAENGSDENDGSREHPFATVAKAKEAVDAINDDMSGDIIVNIGAGKYYMDETLTFDNSDSGTNGHKIIYKNQDGLASAELIGGQKVTSEWELVDASGDPATDADADLPESAEGKVYKTNVGTDVNFNTLYVNDKRATLARTKNRDNSSGFESALTPYMRTAGGGTSDLRYEDGDLTEDEINGLVNAQKRGDLNASIYMWDGGYWDWMTDTIPFTSIDVGSNRLNFKKVEGHPEAYRPKYATRSNARYFVQGNLALLDVPGEYYYNHKTGDLYYYPEGNIEDQDIVIPHVKEIVHVEGESRSNMVENIEFQGLTFKDTDTTDWYAYGWNFNDAGDGLKFYPKEAEGSTQPSYCEQTERIEFQYGNITLKNTKNIAITKSHIKNSGMFGVEIYLANENALVEDCLIEYTGHGGVNVDGGYPGVGGDENGEGYSKGHQVKNCVIHDIGELIGQASGITVQQSGYNTISNVEIYNSPRRGIFFTAGNSRNPNVGFPNGDRDYNRMTDLYTHHNTVEYTYLHDCQQDGGDDGAFFACYLFEGKNYKPNYLNQVVIDMVGSNPSMTDLGCNNINLDMCASGMVLKDVKAINPMNFNMEVNTITQHNDQIVFDNANIDFGTHTNYLDEFDDSRMEYDKIGVTAEYPAEYAGAIGKVAVEEPEDLYFKEDFETGKIDRTKWVASVEGAEITPEFISELAFGGTYGLELNDDAKLERKFDEKLNKVVTVKMFDRQNNNLAKYLSGTRNSSKATSVARADDGENIIGLGLDYNNMNNYVVQLGDTKEATSVPRTFGWHEFKFDYTSKEDVKLYIDGILVKTVPAAGFDYVSLGSDDGKGRVFYDQLYIFGGEPADPVQPLPDIYTIPGTLEAENYLNMSGVKTEEGVVTDIDQNDWMEYNVLVSATEGYNVSFAVSSEEGKAADFDVLLDGKLVKAVTLDATNGEWKNFEERVALKKGVHKIKVVSRTEGWKLDKMEFVQAGKDMPCRVEAEDFADKHGDVKIDGVGLGFISVGDWIDYNVYIPKPGQYKMDFRVAVNKNPGKIDIRANGESLGTVEFPGTGGWDNWETVSTIVEFSEAGSQTIRMNVLASGWNFDYFNMDNYDVTNIQIEGEEYTNESGTKIEDSHLAYIDDGDWVEYKVTVKEPGQYDVNYRVSVNRADGGQVEFLANGESLAVTDLPDSGGWSEWYMAHDTVTFKEAGEYTIRLNVIKGKWNMDYFKLSKVVPSIDKSELEALYKEYCDLVQGDYLDENWAAFTEAFNAVRKTLTDANATQEKVDAVVEACKEAVANLDKKPDTIDGIFKITVNGETTEHKYNDAVTITADAEKDGKKFAYWTAGDEIVSYETTYKFYVSKTVEFTAVYTDKATEAEAKALLTNVFATKRPADGKTDVKFVGELVIPEGYELVNAGLIWSSKEGTDLIVEGGLNPNLKPTYITKISDTNQFSVTIKGMPAGKSIRGSIFATVTNGTETKLIYSAEKKAEAK